MTVGDDASAVGEHCGGLSTKAAGDTSAVGEHSGGAQIALVKTGGDVSAIGEGELQRGVDPRCRGEEDAFSVQAGAAKPMSSQLLTACLGPAHCLRF